MAKKTKPTAFDYTCWPMR